ncbi:hypothetical protein MC885_004773, partial [Smutsia gigantea]
MAVAGGSVRCPPDLRLSTEDPGGHQFTRKQAYRRELYSAAPLAPRTHTLLVVVEMQYENSALETNPICMYKTPSRIHGKQQMMRTMFRGGRTAGVAGHGRAAGPAELACALCGRPLAFLLQLYAPVPGLAGLRVFRNQLPRKNAFYSYELPSEDPPPATESVCLQLKPEFEIVIETEDEVTPKAVEEEDSEISGGMDEAPEEELDSTAKHESREDKIFQKFKSKIALEPEQILRYGRGIAPVWISGENIPQEKDIPECPCGTKRVFEFQVMPQLLSYLKADTLGRSVDWGVLAIFTCAES